MNVTRFKGGELDVAYQLFRDGMVWDGDIASKLARDRLVEAGYAVRLEGMQAMTGAGVVAFLSSPTVWRFLIRRWWRTRRSPLGT